MVFSTGYTFLYDLSTAMIYDANQALSGWGQEYLCDGVKANSMSVDATYPVGISDHPFLQLRLPIVGDMRKAIAEMLLFRIAKSVNRHTVLPSNRRAAGRIDYLK